MWVRLPFYYYYFTKLCLHILKILAVKTDIRLSIHFLQLVVPDVPIAKCREYPSFKSVSETKHICAGGIDGKLLINFVFDGIDVASGWLNRTTSVPKSLRRC